MLAAEKLAKAIALLEASQSGAPVSVSPFNRKKSSNFWERERQACEDIRNVLTCWRLPDFQRIDLNRTMSLLFLNLDHRESSIRMLADQALDAIFRKFQLKFQFQRVIAILLTEFSKKYPARCVCAALNKLTQTIHLSRSHRASVYGLHFMNSMCASLRRPEESIQAAIEKCFPVIFLHVGMSVGLHVEKAEELFQNALCNLQLSGVSNRASCVVIAELSKFVPSILHKAFYKLSSIIFEAEDVEKRSMLTGALITFRLIWGTVIDNITDISLIILRKLFCKVLCCLYSTHNEVVVAALELMEIIISLTPYPILNFHPFSIDESKCSTTLYNSPEKSVDHPLQYFTPTLERLENNSDVGKNNKALETELLKLDELDKSLDASKDQWNSMNDVNTLLDNEGSIISEFTQGQYSRAMSQVTNDENENYPVMPEIVDPLLNCDNYLSAEEELAINQNEIRSGTNTPVSELSTDLYSDSAFLKIPEYLPDDFCNRHDIQFCPYSCLLVARRFLLSGWNRGLRDDHEVRISHKILGLKFLITCVTRCQSAASNAIITYDGEQFLTDIYSFIQHDDDNLVVATLNFLVNVEKSAMFVGGKVPQSGKILSLMSNSLQRKNAVQLKGILQIFANCAQFLVADEQLLASACECAISTLDCDYFLIKIARAEFFSKIVWGKASTYCRQYYQSKCLEVLLRQLFDSDHRVVKAVCDVLPLVVRNAEFDTSRTDLFNYSITDWFSESGLHKIAMVLNLNTDQYSFRCESNNLLIEKNLCCIIENLYSIALSNFHSFQSGFLAGLAELSCKFPPSTYPSVWLSMLTNTSLTSVQQSKLPTSNLLLQLLEIFNASCSSTSDLTALIQIISALFAGIAENAFMQALTDHSSHSKLFTMNLSTDGSDTGHSTNFPVEKNVFEQILIFFLRVFNLYYTIVAEERMQSSQATSNFTIFSRSTSSGLPAADKLSDIARHVTGQSTADKIGFTRNSSRMNNFSFLVGTGIRQHRPTSYLQSAALRSMESSIAGAYKNFLESMKSTSHTKFLEPLEAAMTGFSTILEMVDFSLAKTFLEEFLLYLKMLFDISVQHSAMLIHQFLKPIFNKTAKHINLKILQSLRVKESVMPNDVLEMYLVRSINEFTIFAAFISRAEYLELFLLRDAGWFQGNALQKTVANILDLSDSLHLFDPFITRLMQIYPLTNSSSVRIAILELLCTLLLNDIRYELVDTEKKFYLRVVSQIKQLLREDVPLLGAMFTFFITLSRVSYISLFEVEQYLTEVFSRIEENNVLQILDAAHIVLLESLRITQSGNTGRSDAEDTKRKPQHQIKLFLCKEFNFLFEHCPKAASHLWILLLNGARTSGDSEWWSTMSLDFLTHFNKFVLSKKFSKRSLAASSGVINNTDEYNVIGLTVVLSCCSPSALRPIDKFCECIRNLFAQLPLNNSPNWINANDSVEKEPTLSVVSSPLRQQQLQQKLLLYSIEEQTVATISRILPFCFILLCELDEDVVMLRLNAISKNAVEYFGSNLLNALLSLTNVLHSQDTQWLEQNGVATENIFTFFCHIIIHASRAGKALLIVKELQTQLVAEFCDETNKNASNLLIGLSLSFPKVHAYWFSLCLALNVRCSVSEFYFCDSYLSHTKSLICILIMHKVCENNDKCSQEFCTELLLNANDEFCVRLLKWSESLSSSKKFSKFFMQIPLNVLHLIITKIEHLLSVNYISQILPTFCDCLSAYTSLKQTDENFSHTDNDEEKRSFVLADNFLKSREFMTIFSDCNSLEQKIYALKHLILKKELSGLITENSNVNKKCRYENADANFDFDFCKNLAQFASTDAEFRKICTFLPLFSTPDIVIIFETIHVQHRILFFHALFYFLRNYIRRRVTESFIECGNRSNNIYLADLPENNYANDCELLDNGSEQRILDAILAFLVNPNEKNKSVQEIVCILAHISELPLDYYAVKDDFMSAKCAERLLNDLITYLVTHKLDKKCIPIEYFKALRTFFGFKIVSQIYQNDYYLTENLAQFLNLLWEDTLSKIKFFYDICRWKRLNVDKKHWKVDIESSSGSKLLSLRDEVMQMFNTVQKIVHCFRNNLILEREIELVFKTILRLPLFSKMCVVPESALRLDWSLVISDRGGQIYIPLVNIHMLNDPNVLSDFIWRVLWLGWTCKNQFEEYWMSLFGVLSSTPTASEELHAAAQNQTLLQQIQVSSIAVEALTNLIVYSVLYPEPGNVVNGQYLIWKTSLTSLYFSNGRLASCSKLWLNLGAYGDTVLESSILNPTSMYTHNLEFASTWEKSPSWSNPTVNYGMGHTSVDYLWSITGLVFREDLTRHRTSTSCYLIERSTAFDTTSSLKALFENYFHWCSNGLEQLPISLLCATLKSMALLSDFIDDLTFYCNIFGILKNLFDSKHLDESHPARGYAIYLFLKCASVVEWSDLFDKLNVTSEAEFSKYLESIIELELRRCSAVPPAKYSPPSKHSFQGSQPSVSSQRFLFVGYCTIHGVLYLLQSLAVDNLTNLANFLTDFVMEELHRLQRSADILADCSSDTIEYHKMVWTLAFRIVEAALPINVTHKTNFLKLVCNLFVDPRLPTWQKKLLAHGMESLVIHSCTYSPCFRQTALECFDTCQLRPPHLPFALSVYSTCLYREFAEGGEYAYEINKCFNRDFQKLLNIFLFYSTNQTKCDLLVPVLTDLICLAWAKEPIIDSIWDLIAPIASINARKSPTSSNKKPKNKTDGVNLNSAELLEKLRAPNIVLENSGTESLDTPAPQFYFQLSQFDRSLLCLFYSVIIKLGEICRRTVIELCWNFLLPKLSEVENSEFVQFLALLIMCSASADARVQQKIHLLLNDEDLNTAIPPLKSIAKYVADSFIATSQKVANNSNWTNENLFKFLKKFNGERNFATLRDKTNEYHSSEERISFFL